MFSSYLERCMDIFSRKYSQFSQQIALSSWQNGHAHIANQQGIPGVLWCWPLGPVLKFLYITRTLIGRKIPNHSLAKKGASTGKETFNSYPNEQARNMTINMTITKKMC